jgi:hypothetical protein
LPNNLQLYFKKTCTRCQGSENDGFFKKQALVVFVDMLRCRFAGRPQPGGD